ncbi:hypothetical protein [Francisella philomiragia]|uniref:Uncharacterized protein n=1 Tax=Francisella philomiragia TaxID=28110 RepID=A0ABS1GDM3_9GAMM|nr:hypothetical protein [Francisella philomiragia]MBK2259180.1 hypothetical protein [Francisella philomiragia]MBK2302783.1 hypothetical protein [Francisella philomiragia]
MTTKKDKKGTLYIANSSIEIKADKKELLQLYKTSLAKNECFHDVLKTFLINTIEQTKSITVDNI